jgi:D-alanyl-lipoteichoic acid acyltransferase DltB (MBOAT superfamily)
MGKKYPKKFILISGLMVSLCCLVVFKYIDFIGESISSLGSLFTGNIKYKSFDLILPIGISFYSFKLVSYVLDVYAEKIEPERHLGYFALYVSFFPQLLAGPIDRAKNFLPELKKKIDVNFDRITDGLKLVAWGFFKKLVIADNLAPTVNRIYDNVQDHNGLVFIFATILFSLQIYCDFSGYSDIAIGLSRVLGFKSMENFRSPYLSKSITQFWSKWHISLSTWLRDYLFLPIAYRVMRGIRKPRVMKVKVETWGYITGMSITMFLGGLWHGAKWTLVLWGAVHGLYLVLSYATRKIRKKIVKKIGIIRFPKIHRIIKITLTFLMVSFAWIFFKADSIEDSMYIMTHMFTGADQLFYDVFNNIMLGFTLEPVRQFLKSLGIVPYEFSFVLIAVIILFLADKASEKKDIWVRLKAKPLPLRLITYYFLIMGILLFAKADGGQFIYFQF